MRTAVQLQGSLSIDDILTAYVSHSVVATANGVLGIDGALTVWVLHAVVAMSGGTGSALLAYIVASVFDENTVACIGRSGSVPCERLHRARYTADLMGDHQLLPGQYDLLSFRVLLHPEL